MNFMEGNQNVTITHIMFFSETWLTQDYPSDKLQMQDFSLHCMENLHNSHHGMILYIHKDIQVQCMHKISNCDMEAIKLENIYNDNILTIIGTTTSATVKNTNIHENNFTGIPDKKYVIVLGDFNMNVNELTGSYNISQYELYSARRKNPLSLNLIKCIVFLYFMCHFSYACISSYLDNLVDNMSCHENEK